MIIGDGKRFLSAIISLKPTSEAVGPPSDLLSE
jgi:hypothetical protein